MDKYTKFFETWLKNNPEKIWYDVESYNNNHYSDSYNKYDYLDTLLPQFIRKPKAESYLSVELFKLIDEVK